MDINLKEQQEWLQAALDAAAAAAKLIRGHYSAGVAVETKADKTPVTEADRAAERAIRDILQQRFPDHGFYGEEFGRQNADAAHLWLIDPIDGTKSFVRGYPFFSTQIALMVNDRIVVGVSSAPLFEQTAWALHGGGAYLDGEPLDVSSIASLEQASLSSGNLASLARSVAWMRYGEIVSQVDRIRGYGDFYHYHLLAKGSIDAVIESDLNILDVAALSLIVEEAGGRFTTLDGKRVHLDMHDALATNGLLHDALVDAIDWKSAREEDL